MFQGAVERMQDTECRRGDAVMRSGTVTDMNMESANHGNALGVRMGSETIVIVVDRMTAEKTGDGVVKAKGKPTVAIAENAAKENPDDPKDGKGKE